MENGLVNKNETCYYLSQCYAIAWGRLSNQFYLCLCMCQWTHLRHIFQPIFTKFGKDFCGPKGKNRLGWGRNPTMPSLIFTQKNPKFTADIGNSSQILNAK